VPHWDRASQGCDVLAYSAHLYDNGPRLRLVSPLIIFVVEKLNPQSRFHDTNDFNDTETMTTMRLDFSGDGSLFMYDDAWKFTPFIIADSIIPYCKLRSRSPLVEYETYQDTFSNQCLTLPSTDLTHLSTLTAHDTHIDLKYTRYLPST
jgi:hypothetical protein